MNKKLSSKNDLREVGLKITEPRVRILELFKRSKNKHLSADDIFSSLRDKDKNISIATIYRVLTTFEQTGILKKYNFSGEHSVFEIKSDSHHDHMLCISCGEVVEFFDSVVEDRQVEIAKNNSFKITDRYMIIYGLCEGCVLDH